MKEYGPKDEPYATIEDDYGDGDVPEVDGKPYDSGDYAEPLPESTRPRRDGPGGD